MWNSDFSFADTDVVRDQLYQLCVHKSMGTDGIHPRVLRELTNVMAGHNIHLRKVLGAWRVPVD